MKTLATKTSTFLWLLVVWLFVSTILAYRISVNGAYSSACATKTLDFIKSNALVDPASVRLNQSYAQWALSLNMTDSSNYIKVGLGMSDGKGLSVKNITPANPNNKDYLAYYFQAPGTPIVIGTMIKIFGPSSVMPYFILVSVIHFICALLACVLAEQFIKDKKYILGVGILSLLSLPVLDFDFGVGLFCAEPFAALFVGLALIALGRFYRGLQQPNYSYKALCLSALFFGGSLGLAAYFRDIYAVFAYFVFVVLILSALTKLQKLKRIALFVLISAIVLSAIEYPWQKRNQHYFNEFTMAGSTYCGYSLWNQIWGDKKDLAEWSWDAGTGLGNYLAPEKSNEVLQLLEKNKQVGSKYAAKCLIEAICKKPWQAILYKLRVYDTLWFGQECHRPIYLWCIISSLSLSAFIWLTRFRFIPELYLFPFFMICISCLAHYEHRYVQPFFIFITPVTMMYVIKHWREKNHLVG